MFDVSMYLWLKRSTHPGCDLNFLITSLDVQEVGMLRQALHLLFRVIVYSNERW